MNRRNFIQQAGILTAGSILVPHILRATGKDNPTILLVSGWQDVNIGDIAHTPGLLHVLETYIPKATIILWKRSKGEEVHALLKQNFPKVKIIYGGVLEDRSIDSEEVLNAFKEADLMVHGSGPSVVGQSNLEAWVKNNQKPFGIFGTTIQDVSDSLKTLLQKASFIFTKETDSLKVLEKEGFEGKNIAFSPDATFYMDIRNDQKANAFLEENNLEDKKFICAIPRLRYTPYHKFRKSTNWSEEKIAHVEKVNEEKKEVDHAKLREAMIAYVRETGNKVLVCPEMTYEVDIMDELLIDPLPEDVKPNVIKRGYWLPDEAASVYDKALAVLSFECHSPIMAIFNGTPSFYLRHPEDTIKGQMYYDLGFQDWVFEIEETTGEMITDRLREVWTNYSEAKGKIKKNMKKIDQIYKDSCKVIKELV